ncbi:hypothetical protein SK355_09550 [Candidatus Fukatsuia symbiotica]|uniref:Uncharacterized protein n=1 Tax=Candidatus Fukatsuia symbiotica TaxID=1878942 RepID=A0A2U8I3F6_9GAMM|nr:hypothetical protein [Candidatus Fukatsuia symbiotica]AWK13643.1 hypothetical protein CCS41_02675 [Candidatus Fukatsuia symbiotica]MEA9445462.1 hypothetical protein [Candidatus Fukatsuia symbiotica]
MKRIKTFLKVLLVLLLPMPIFAADVCKILVGVPTFRGLIKVCTKQKPTVQETKPPEQKKDEINKWRPAPLWFPK